MMANPTCAASTRTTKVAVRMVDGSPDLYVLAVCDLPAGHFPTTEHEDRNAGWRWGATSGPEDSP